MDSLSDNWIFAMEEREEEVPVAKRWSIGNWMMPMEEEVLAAKIFSYELRNFLMGRSGSEFNKLEDRIWKLKTEYHQRKRTELDQVADIWIDIKKLKEEGHISTGKMQALMSHFRSMLGYFAGNGFHPTSPFDHTFRFYCSALLREVAAYSDQEKELIQIGYPRAMYVPRDIYSPIKWVTAEKDISPLFIESFPMVPYETDGTGGTTMSSGRLRNLDMLKHFLRFKIFAVLSYGVLYLLLPDDGGRGITRIVPFWMMAFQVYFMAIIVYSYFRRVE